MTPSSQHFRLRSNLFFMTDVFTPKRSKQRQAKFSILNLPCEVWLHSVKHTMKIDSAMQCTPRRLTLWCDEHSGDWLGGLMHTTEIDLAVWCPPRRFWDIVCSWLLINLDQLTLRYDVQREDLLSGVMHTTEIELAVWCTPQRSTPLWDALCGVYLKNWISQQNQKKVENKKRMQNVCTPVHMGWIMKKIEVNNLVTHSL